MRNVLDWGEVYYGVAFKILFFFLQHLTMAISSYYYPVGPTIARGHWGKGFLRRGAWGLREGCLLWWGPTYYTQKGQQTTMVITFKYYEVQLNY